MSTETTQVRPLFKIAQAYAKQNCRTAQSSLANGDLAAFTAFDATLNQPWLDNWVSLSDAADEIPTDEVYRDNMEQHTALVKTAMQNSRAMYKTVKYFATKAFPNNKGAQKEFGFDDYDKSRQSAELMHQFMKNMHATVEEHQALLTSTAIGFPEGDIERIETLAADLLAANTAQEQHKDRQTSATRERILALNAVWAPRQLLAAAAKIIYEDNYAKYQEYLLPPSEASPEDFGIMGMVQDAASNAPLADATVTISELSLELLTDQNGNYGFADNIPPGDYVIQFSKDGYAPFESAVTVSSADETIIVNALMNAL